MFILNTQTIHLQISSQHALHSKAIIKSIRGPDDKLSQRSAGRSWLKSKDRLIPAAAAAARITESEEEQVSLK